MSRTVINQDAETTPSHVQNTPQTMGSFHTPRYASGRDPPEEIPMEQDAKPAGKRSTRTSKDEDYRFPSMPMLDIECLGDFYDYIYEHFEEALGDKNKTLNTLRNKFLVTTMDDLERILIISMEKLEEDFGPTDDHENMENFPQGEDGMAFHQAHATVI